MKKIFFFLLTIGAFNNIQAQKLTSGNRVLLQQMEASLKVVASQFVYEEEWIDRFRADSFLIPALVKALKINNSFYYPFDSMKTISRLYAPDSSFRIFTWQVKKSEAYYRQRGAIQMRTDDGSLKLFPLFDCSDFTKAPNDSVRDNKNWIGAIYYKILLNTFNDKKTYTLLGLDENDTYSNKKWIEVLTFDATGKPQFGGRYFQYKNDPTKPLQPAFRFNLEYKKDARVTMNYDLELNLIVFDHLISESNDVKNKASFIPEGSYEGFRWSFGKWIHVPNVAFDGASNNSLTDPLFNTKGELNQKKLNEISNKNQRKADPYKLDDKKKKPLKPEDKVDY